MNLFVHKESEVAASLGVSRMVVESIRRQDLQMHKHWKIVANTVMLTEKGKSMVLKKLSVLSEKKGAAPVGLGEPAAADVASADEVAQEGVSVAVHPSKSIVGDSGEKMAVVTRKFPNKKIMEAAMGGVIVRVRVSSSDNFRIGMEIPVRTSDQTGGLWDCTRRAPRFPGGRW